MATMSLVACAQSSSRPEVGASAASPAHHICHMYVYIYIYTHMFLGQGLGWSENCSSCPAFLSDASLTNHATPNKKVSVLETRYGVDTVEQCSMLLST